MLKVKGAIGIVVFHIQLDIQALVLGGDSMSTQEAPLDGKSAWGWELGYKFCKPTYDPAVGDSSET